MPWLQEAETLRQAPGTLTVLVDRGGPVRVSFFATPTLRRLREPLSLSDPSIRLASLLDLAGTQASVVQQRAEAKDYLDIDALLRAGVSLSLALAATRDRLVQAVRGVDLDRLPDPGPAIPGIGE